MEEDATGRQRLDRDRARLEERRSVNIDAPTPSTAAQRPPEAPAAEAPVALRSDHITVEEVMADASRKRARDRCDEPMDEEDLFPAPCQQDKRARDPDDHEDVGESASKRLAATLKDQTRMKRALEESHRMMSDEVYAQKGLRLRQDDVVALTSENGVITGVKTGQGECIQARKVILTTGTFLGGKLVIGQDKKPGGRAGVRQGEGAPAARGRLPGPRPRAAVTVCLFVCSLLFQLFASLLPCVWRSGGGARSARR